ncbi:putative coiled-coil domain-containing protein 144C [Molossus nigricans]
MLDIGDNNNETALIQAVKYQQEECATILLDNGAYPDVANVNGNTALHYAVLGHNMAIVEKLLSCGANLEVKNRDGLTPLSLAQRENKKEVVSLLLNSGAALPTVNEMESNQQQTSDNEEERRPETCSEKRNLVDKSSEEVSLRRNPGRDNSLALSVDEDCKDEVISKTCMPTAKTSENQSKQIHLPPLHLEKKSQESEVNRACVRVDISEQSGHSSVQNHDKNRGKKERLEEKKKLKLAREELNQMSHEFCVKFKYVSDEKPQLPEVFPFPSHPWLSSSEDAAWLPNSKVCLGKKTLHSENDHKPDTEHVLNKKEESLCDDTENKIVRDPVVPFEVEEDKEFDIQMTKNMNPNTTNWKLGIGHAPQCSDPKNHLDLQLAHGNETKHMIPKKSQDASAVKSTCKETNPNQDSFQKPLNVQHYNASNCKSVESNLEDWSFSAPCNDRTPKVHINEKLQQNMQRVQNNADMCRAELLALGKEKVQLQKEDKLSPLSLAQSENKEQTMEFPVKRRASTPVMDETESNSGLDNSWDLSDDGDCKVSDHFEKREYMLHENHVLKDKNAKLSPGKGTVKNQNQEMDKKYFENMKIVKEKNDHFHKTIKHNEDILTKTIFQHNEQLNLPSAEITKLNLKLENEKRNRERLETEVKLYKSRLATVKQDHERCQKSKRDLQLAFEREKDEWFCLQDEINFDISSLKDDNDILCQEISKVENKFSRLEIELNQARDDLREKTLVLEGVQRDITQTQCQRKEIEHLCKKKKDKLQQIIENQRSLEEELSHLQSENKLLRQQLDDAHNKAGDEEMTHLSSRLCRTI